MNNKIYLPNEMMNVIYSSVGTHQIVEKTNLNHIIWLYNRWNDPNLCNFSFSQYLLYGLCESGISKEKYVKDNYTGYPWNFEYVYSNKYSDEKMYKNRVTKFSNILDYPVIKKNHLKEIINSYNKWSDDCPYYSKIIYVSFSNFVLNKLEKYGANKEYYIECYEDNRALKRWHVDSEGFDNYTKKVFESNDDYVYTCF